jgi:ATP-dependent protease ClpP protease subunit
MPLVPAVTELIIAELLYLNYESTTDPITMYINSSGTSTADGQQVGFETEAFAIADVMKVRATGIPLSNHGSIRLIVFYSCNAL